MSFMESAKVGLAWIAGCLLAVLFLGFAAGAGSFLPLVLGVVACMVVLPPGRAFIASKMGGWMPKKELTWTLVIGCFIGGVVLMNSGIQEDADKAAKAEAEQAQQAAAAALRALREEYAAKKIALTAEIEGLIAGGQFDKADGLLSKYRSVAAGDFKALETKLGAARARLALKQEGNLSLKERVVAYRAIHAAETSNSALESKLRGLEAQLAKQEEREKAEALKQQALAARKAAITKQFSAWDGSHPAVERAVKEMMKNPKSYEHVETRFSIQNSGFMVFTTARGTNAFGGVVPQTFIAKLSDDGTVLSIASD